MKKNLQNGFAHLGLVLLLAVVVVVGFVGYKVVNNSKTPISNTTSTSATVAPIKGTSDLDKVKSTLNSTDLDKDLNSTALDQDVNSLL
jgi:uncharacterized protein (UPF0333 family)